MCSLLSKRVLITGSALLLVMFVIGSFFDYSISRMIYNESSPFGIFFAAFGEYPAALGFVAAGAMLYFSRNRERRLIGVLQSVAGGWFILSGAAMAVILPAEYMGLPIWQSAVIGLVCTALTVWGILWLCREADTHTVILVAVVFVCVIFADILVVNLIKIPWGRARMRLVANDYRAYFMPWWQPGSDLKDTLIAAGVAAEEFKSFPSGHSANASALMLLSLLPTLERKLANKKMLLFGIGSGWAGIVAFSRIIMGAHYLTDTVIGLSIGFAVLIIVNYIVFRKSSAAQSR